jgi:hypothetical protein
MPALELVGEDEEVKDDLIQQEIAHVSVTEASIEQTESHSVDLEDLSTSDAAQPVRLPRSQELAFWSGTSTAKGFNFDSLFKDGSLSSASFSGSNSAFAYQSMSPFPQLSLPSYAAWEACPMPMQSRKLSIKVSLYVSHILQKMPLSFPDRLRKQCMIEPALNSDRNLHA